MKMIKEKNINDPQCRGLYLAIMVALIDLNKGEKLRSNFLFDAPDDFHVV